MRAILSLLTILLIFVTSAIAEPRQCIDTLGGAKYGKELRHIPNSFAIGGFANTFGDFFPVAKKELDSGRSFIRVNLSWRDDHNYGSSDMKEILREARRYQILCSAYPGRIEIATFTEHNLDKPDTFHDRVQKAAPNCTIVNTPWKGKLSKKYKNEVHGNHSKPSGAYNYSYDGTNSVDSNVVADRAKHKTSDMFCMWHPRLNGKWSMKDTTPRPQRKAWPDKDMLESLTYLFTDKGNTSIPKGWLVKSHAEKHGPEDKKGDKLLIISPKKTDSIKLKRNGDLKAVLPYYGVFDGGGHRYYAPQYGYKYGASLEVWQGNKQYGVINGGFRDGNYR